MFFGICFLLFGPAVANQEWAKSQVHEDFNSFRQQYGRNYLPGTFEYEQRMELFQQRSAEAEKLNGVPGMLWTAGVGPLWDRTAAELHALRGWRGAASSTQGLQGGERAAAIFTQVNVLPEQFLNWTTLAALREVANQGHCGSCWAVASSMVLKANAEIHGSSQRSFSAQELVDCVPNPHSCGGEGGCKGATVELAMNYVMHLGLGTESEVPYRAKTGACHRLLPGRELAGLALTNLQSTTGTDDAIDDDDNNGEDLEAVAMHEELVALRVLHDVQDLQSAGIRHARKNAHGLAFGMRGWEKLPENQYEPLLRAVVEHGPVGVSVAASDWHLYSGGVFNGCTKDAVIDHAVTLVGFGKDQMIQHKFWLIQNSWGADWGESGRIRLLRTDSDETEQCGIDRQPEKGTACKGGPTEVRVCGMCGILYDSAVPHF